jgi:coproporphyrinogen III oxidase
MLEVRTTNFFFKFPDELDVDRKLPLKRQARAKERGQRRSLVIRRSATVIASIFGTEDEGRPGPLRFIGRLDIEMVVDGHGGVIRSALEAADHHRITRSGEFFRRPAAAANVREGVIREFVDVSTMVARCTDARYLNPFFQFGFKFVLHALIVPQSLRMTWRQRAEDYFRGLQDRICSGLEAADGTRFREDHWSREGGGGGRTRVMEAGELFEKAGVNFSAVSGDLPEEFAKKIPRGEGTAFFATGVSLVLHPSSPMIPTVHANFRYLEKGDANWFGGGMDLTPYYPHEEDAIHFHRTIKTACDRHNSEFYPRFKKWCDEYFFLKHRGETRGVGGIFFDYLDGDRERNFAFVSEIGDAFLNAYIPIVERRRSDPFDDRHRQFQLYRRGRYVEFNLLYDRGTIFGLETRGRTESILMSLPPLVRWVYDYRPEPGSLEARNMEFFKPKDWV